MKNVKEAANARAVLGCYHPLWLRLGAEVVIGKAAAGASVALARALVVVMSASSSHWRSVWLLPGILNAQPTHKANSRPFSCSQRWACVGS